MSLKKVSFATLLVLVLASFHFAESTNSTNEETRLKRAVSCPYGQAILLEYVYCKLYANETIDIILNLFIKHPSYDANNFLNDISLFHLSYPLAL